MHEEMGDINDNIVSLNLKRIKIKISGDAMDTEVNRHREHDFVAEDNKKIIDKYGRDSCTIRCILCGLGNQHTLGQGPLSRWRWPDESISLSSVSRRICERQEDEQLCLDTVRVSRENKVPGTDGKRCLAGIVNAFLDCEGRPFGLVEELSLVGVRDDEKAYVRIEEGRALVYAHDGCVIWGKGSQNTSSLCLATITAVTWAQQCNYCLRAGASIICSVAACTHVFHYPCASASGCFQDLENVKLWCPEHCQQADISNERCICSMCERKGEISDLIYCTSCGQHYHNNCLEPPLVLSPTVRAGWQCAECKTCLMCSESKDEKKMLVCDVCDKGFHTYCLQPPMAAIPKNGWKCDSCRVCNDCGFTQKQTATSVSPQVPNVRWHNNYTLCDRCAQTRRRGHSTCAVCDRAWRCSITTKDATGQPMNKWSGRKCNKCRKMVHTECDPAPGIMPSPVYSLGSSSSGGAAEENSNNNVAGNTHYQCPACRNRESATPSEVASTRTSPMPGSYCGDEIADDLEEDEENTSLSGIDPLPSRMLAFDSQCSSTLNRGISNEPGYQSNSVDDSSTISGSTTPQTYCQSSGNGKFQLPLGTGRSSKDKVHDQNHPCSKKRPLVVAKGKSKSAGGKSSSMKKSSTLNSKRSRRAKARKINVCESKNAEEKDEHPSTVVICRADDAFVLDQDMCVACGSFGIDAPMLCCVQCGQCYHSYCAEVTKLTKVILEKGWRCLDCTVCEGCGQASDENLLLLCDDCDISFHTFCLDPPLKEVPKGSWKCQNCVLCHFCGRKDPGPNGHWQNNYTTCAPCSSKVQCPVCQVNYNEGELMLLCDVCERSAHAACDQLNTEAELEFVFEGGGYHCVLCREKGVDVGPGHKQLLHLRATHGDSVTQTLVADRTAFNSLVPPLDQCRNPLLTPVGAAFDEPQSPEASKNFFMDNVVLSESGLNTIRNAMLKIQPRRNLNALKRAQKCASLEALAEHDGKQLKMEPSEAQMSVEGGNTAIGNHMDEDSLQSVEGDTAATDLKSPSVQSDDGSEVPTSATPGGNVPSTPVCKSGSKSTMPRNRRFSNLGIGGFRARSTRVSQMKKSAMAAVSSVDQGSAQYTIENFTAKQSRRRQLKKKSEIEENYPDYLMEAFLGTGLLNQSAETPRKSAGGLKTLAQGHLDSRSFCSAGSSHTANEEGDEAEDNERGYDNDDDSDNLNAAQEASQFMLLDAPAPSSLKCEADVFKVECGSVSTPQAASAPGTVGGSHANQRQMQLELSQRFMSQKPASLSGHSPMLQTHPIMQAPHYQKKLEMEESLLVMNSAGDNLFAGSNQFPAAAAFHNQGGMPFEDDFITSDDYLLDEYFLSINDLGMCEEPGSDVVSNVAESSHVVSISPSTLHMPKHAPDDGGLTQLPELTVTDIETHLGPSSIENLESSAQRRSRDNLAQMAAHAGMDSHFLISSAPNPEPQEMGGPLKAELATMLMRQQHASFAPSQWVASNLPSMSAAGVQVSGDSGVLMDMGGGSLVSSAQLMHPGQLKGQLFQSANPASRRPGQLAFQFQPVGPPSQSGQQSFHSVRSFDGGHLQPKVQFQQPGAQQFIMCSNSAPQKTAGRPLDQPCDQIVVPQDSAMALEPSLQRTAESLAPLSQKVLSGRAPVDGGQQAPPPPPYPNNGSGQPPDGKIVWMQSPSVPLTSEQEKILGVSDSSLMSSQQSPHSSYSHSPHRGVVVSTQSPLHSQYGQGNVQFSKGNTSIMIQMGQQMESPDKLIKESLLSPECYSQVPRPKNISNSSQDTSDTSTMNTDAITPTVSTPTSSQSNKRINFIKWQDDEQLGDKATIAPVLFANSLHPNLRHQFADIQVWSREIQKLWRKLNSDDRQHWVNKSRMNKSTKKSGGSTSSGNSQSKKKKPAAASTVAGSVQAMESPIKFLQQQQQQQQQSNIEQQSPGSMHQASPYQQHIAGQPILQSPPLAQKHAQYSSFVQQSALQPQQQQQNQMNVGADILNMSAQNSSKMCQQQMNQMNQMRYKYEFTAPQEQQNVYQPEFLGQQQQGSMHVQVHQQGLMATSSIQQQHASNQQKTIMNSPAPTMLESELINACKPQYSDSGMITTNQPTYHPPAPPPTWPPASTPPMMLAPSSLSTYHRLKNQPLGSQYVTTQGSMLQGQSQHVIDKFGKEKLSAPLSSSDEVVYTQCSGASSMGKEVHSQMSAMDPESNAKLKEMLSKCNMPKSSPFSQQMYLNQGSAGCSADSMLACPSPDGVAHGFSQNLLIRSNSIPLSTNLDSCQEQEGGLAASFPAMSRASKGQSQQVMPLTFSQGHLEEAGLQAQQVAVTASRQFQTVPGCYLDSGQPKYSLNQQQYLILESSEGGPSKLGQAHHLHGGHSLGQQQQQLFQIQQRGPSCLGVQNSTQMEGGGRAHQLATNLGASPANYLGQQKYQLQGQKYQVQGADLCQMRVPYRTSAQPQYIGGHLEVGEDPGQADTGPQMDTRISPGLMQSPLSPYAPLHHQALHPAAHKFQQPSRPISTGVSKGYDLAGMQIYSPRDSHTPQSAQVPPTPHSPSAGRSKTPMSPSSKAPAMTQQQVGAMVSGGRMGTSMSPTAAVNTASPVSGPQLSPLHFQSQQSGGAPSNLSGEHEGPQQLSFGHKASSQGHPLTEGTRDSEFGIFEPPVILTRVNMDRKMLISTSGDTSIIGKDQYRQKMMCDPAATSGEPCSSSGMFPTGQRAPSSVASSRTFCRSISSSQEDSRSSTSLAPGGSFMYRSINEMQLAQACNPPSHLDDVIDSVVSGGAVTCDDSSIVQRRTSSGSGDSSGSTNSVLMSSSIFDQEKSSVQTILMGGGDALQDPSRLHQIPTAQRLPSNNNVINQTIQNQARNISVYNQCANSANIVNQPTAISSKNSPNNFWLTSSNIGASVSKNQMCLSNTQVLGAYNNQNQSKLIQHGQNIYQMYAPGHPNQQIIYANSSPIDPSADQQINMLTVSSLPNRQVPPGGQNYQAVAFNSISSQNFGGYQSPVNVGSVDGEQMGVSSDQSMRSMQQGTRQMGGAAIVKLNQQHFAGVPSGGKAGGGVQMPQGQQFVYNQGQGIAMIAQAGGALGSAAVMGPPVSGLRPSTGMVAQRFICSISPSAGTNPAGQSPQYLINAAPSQSQQISSLMIASSQDSTLNFGNYN